jgi:hypothetical protein
MSKYLVNIHTGERLDGDVRRLEKLRGNPKKKPKNWAWNHEEIPLTANAAALAVKTAEVKLSALEQENARLKAMLEAAQTQHATVTAEAPPKRTRKVNPLNTSIEEAEDDQ